MLTIPPATVIKEGNTKDGRQREKITEEKKKITMF